jgi:S-phase kinase-associated protein 1
MINETTASVPASVPASVVPATTDGALNTISNRLVRLVSKEGDAFEVELDIIAVSKLVLATASERGDEDEEEEEDEILLPAVSTRILARVVEFARHYHSDPMTEFERPLKSAILSEIVQQWYADFINVDNSTLVDLVNAVNYMELKPLLSLCQAAIAAKIKDKTPEQIRANLAMPVPDVNNADDANTADAAQKGDAPEQMVGGDVDVHAID